MEIKETYGKRAKFAMKPKDFSATYFLFFYPPENLYLLCHRTGLKVEKYRKKQIKATSFSLKQIKDRAFFNTTDDELIVEKVSKI